MNELKRSDLGPPFPVHEHRGCPFDGQTRIPEKDHTCQRKLSWVLWDDNGDLVWRVDTRWHGAVAFYDDEDRALNAVKLLRMWGCLK